MRLQQYLYIVIIMICTSCDQPQKPSDTKAMSPSNPVVYFEIPVNDLERAEKFYTEVFNFSFEKEIIDHYEMALFPFEEKSSGIRGTLAKGDVYKPTKNEVIIYFKTENIGKSSPAWRKNTLSQEN